MTPAAATADTPSPRVVLASASTGRLAVLRAAGIDPEIMVSGIDEDALLTEWASAPPEKRVAALASAKATAVIDAHQGDSRLADAVVIGGDSMLLLGGELQGKPHTRDVAMQRWRAQAGRSGTLVTGHAVLRVCNGIVSCQAEGTACTTVHIGTPTDDELSAYLDTGEPLEVAGSLTIDGLGGWFVDGIDGDPSCVVGLSLPLTRRLLADVGIRVTDLWTASASASMPAASS